MSGILTPIPPGTTVGGGVHLYDKGGEVARYKESQKSVIQPAGPPDPPVQTHPASTHSVSELEDALKKATDAHDRAVTKLSELQDEAERRKNMPSTNSLKWSAWMDEIQFQAMRVDKLRQEKEEAERLWADAHAKEQLRLAIEAKDEKRRTVLQQLKVCDATITGIVEDLRTNLPTRLRLEEGKRNQLLQELAAIG
jgi:hypothetical protein